MSKEQSRACKSCGKDDYLIRYDGLCGGCRTSPVECRVCSGEGTLPAETNRLDEPRIECSYCRGTGQEARSIGPSFNYCSDPRTYDAVTGKCWFCRTKHSYRDCQSPEAAEWRKQQAVTCPACKSVKEEWGAGRCAEHGHDQIVSSKLAAKPRLSRSVTKCKECGKAGKIGLHTHLCEKCR